MHNALMIFLVGALSIPVAQTVAAAPSPQTYLPKALAGDYQAQRNLA